MVRTSTRPLTNCSKLPNSYLIELIFICEMIIFLEFDDFKYFNSWNYQVYLWFIDISCKDEIKSFTHHHFYDSDEAVNNNK